MYVVDGYGTRFFKVEGTVVTICEVFCDGMAEIFIPHAVLDYFKTEQAARNYVYSWRRYAINNGQLTTRAN